VHREEHNFSAVVNSTGNSFQTRYNVAHPKFPILDYTPLSYLPKRANVLSSANGLSISPRNKSFVVNDD
jgi:hypothetical protein